MRRLKRYGYEQQGYGVTPVAGGGISPLMGGGDTRSWVAAIGRFLTEGYG